MTVVDVVKKGYVDAQDQKLSIPVVLNDADRLAQYPVPLENQRVHNLSNDTIEKYTAALGWTPEFQGVGGTRTKWNTKAFGLTGDSVFDDYVKLNALVNGTMQPAGGTLEVVGVLRTGTSLIIPANVRLEFISEAQLAPDALTTLTISGAFNRHLDQKFSGGGTVLVGSLMPYICPEWFGATGLNNQDDAPAIKRAAGAMPVRGKLIFRAGGNYRLDTSAAWTSTSYSTYVAWGAQFITSVEMTAIDINLGADPLNPVGTIRNNITWKGGLITTTAGTKLTSVAFKCFNIRNCKVAGLRWEGFWKGIQFAGADTYTFDQTHSFNTSIGYHSPDWSAAAGGNTISVVWEKCHHSCNGQLDAVLVEGYAFDFHINGGSVNGNVLRGFHFKSVVGQVSSTFSITRVHYEQGDINTTYVLFEDTAGTGFNSVAIEKNSFTYAPPTAINLQRVGGVAIEKNRFAQTIVGGGQVLNADVNCTSGVFGAGNKVAAGTPRLTLGTRSEWTIGAAIIPQNDFPITGFDNTVLATSNGTIDTSAALAAIYPALADPKGWFINAQIKDSASVGATTLRLLLSKGGVVANQQRMALLKIPPNAPNNTAYGAGFFVPADNNGDINFDVIGSGGAGTPTLTTSLAVTGIVM